MIIWWDTSKTPGGGGGQGSSIDPGVQNVLTGVNYQIDGAARVGTFNIFAVNSPASTDIVSMAMDALGTWLAANISGLTVLDEWPYGNQKLTYPSITTFTGQAKRTPLMNVETLSVTSPDSNNKVVATEVVAQYDFKAQLDLWARNKLERKQVLAKLLTAFNYSQVDTTGSNNPDGLNLTLSNYYNQIVSYEIDWHQHKDDEQSSERQERRELISILVNLREIRQRTYYAMVNIQTETGVGTSDNDTSNLETNNV
jgi:hypothetical protein